MLLNVAFQFHAAATRDEIRLFHVSAQPLVFRRILRGASGSQSVEDEGEVGDRLVIGSEQCGVVAASFGSPSARLGASGAHGVIREPDFGAIQTLEGTRWTSNCFDSATLANCMKLAKGFESPTLGLQIGKAIQSSLFPFV